MDSSKQMEIVEKYCELKEDRMFIKCSNAFKAAEELSISLAEMSKLCNENKIKVMGCQLGCF